MKRSLMTLFMLTLLLARLSTAQTTGSESRDGAGTYAELLKTWKSMEDINGWIGRNFTYDMDKALNISRSGISESRSGQILSPEDFVFQKKGICVDLARFGYETLSKIAPELKPRYLMIEFVPIEKDDSVLRLHWIVLFQRDGKYFTYADSNRPGVIDGPYDGVDALLAAYATFRGREVVSHKVLESYKKNLKKRKARPVGQTKATTTPLSR